MGCQSTHWEQEREGKNGKGLGGELQKASKTVLNRNSNCTSPAHFSLALGTSHQLLHYNCFQHIQPCFCCMTETPVPAKQQCSRQKSFTTADLYQYKIWCLLQGKQQKDARTWPNRNIGLYPEKDRVGEIQHFANQRIEKENLPPQTIP